MAEPIRAAEPLGAYLIAWHPSFGRPILERRLRPTTGASLAQHYCFAVNAAALRTQSRMASASQDLRPRVKSGASSFWRRRCKLTPHSLSLIPYLSRRRTSFRPPDLTRFARRRLQPLNPSHRRLMSHPGLTRSSRSESPAVQPLRELPSNLRAGGAVQVGKGCHALPASAGIALAPW